MTAVRPQLHVLNGMRGVAALAVVALHFGQDGLDLAPGGYLAVDLFFLLSGVVVASAYDGRLARGMGTAAFMRVRLIRLYPMYLLGLALCVALGSVAYPITPGVFALQAALLPAPPNGGDYSLYPAMQVAWTLGLEIAVNLAFAALHRWLTDARLAGVVVAAGAAMAALVVRHGSLDGGYHWPTVPLGLARVLFGFPAGVLLWRYRSRLAVPLSPWLVLPAVALIAAIDPDDRAAYDLAVALAGWPLLVAGAAASTADWPVLGWLGRLSYPAYCLHIAFRSGRLAPDTPGTALAAAAGVVALALFAERFYDRPIRGWLTQISATAAPLRRYSPAAELPKGHE